MPILAPFQTLRIAVRGRARETGVYSRKWPSDPRERAKNAITGRIGECFCQTQTPANLRQLIFMIASEKIDLRAVILKVNDARKPRDQLASPLQSSDVLSVVANQIEIQKHPHLEQALLTQFSNLFRSGHLAWGYNLTNDSPPFFHVTDQGERALENYSRDPSNPAGYFSYVKSNANLNDIAESYLGEAVNCYNADLVKAAAVMVGAATESLILELRDALKTKLRNDILSLPKGLTDWRVKTFANSVQKYFEGEKKNLPRELRESFEANWTSFVHQIRAARNDAGHPVSIDPVTQPQVHASLLIYPELIRLQNRLLSWLKGDS